MEITCDNCKKGLLNINDLEDHAESMHDDSKSSCDLCKDRFMNITALKKHETSMHND